MDEGFWSRIERWLLGAPDHIDHRGRPIYVYGRATSIDGKRATIKPEEREEYDATVRRIRERARRGNP